MLAVAGHAARHLVQTEVACRLQRPGGVPTHYRDNSPGRLLKSFGCSEGCSDKYQLNNVIILIVFLGVNGKLWQMT